LGAIKPKGINRISDKVTYARGGKP